jgi:hypothetical protein
MKFASATRDVSDQIISRSEANSNRRQWRFSGRNALGSYLLEFIAEQDGIGTVFISNRGGQKATTYKVISATHNLTSFSWHIDGSAESNTQSGTGDGTILDNGTIPASIGAVNVLSTPAAFLQGSISEIIVYSRALTTDERVGVEQYLKAKYSL